MKIISWNVNGFRSCIEKGFYEYFQKEDADIFCLQEIKMQKGQVDENILGYYSYINCAEKKGYSGTMVYTKKLPLNVFYGIDGLYNDEGRIITLEYENFYFVVAYVPNSQRELLRLEYRMIFEDKMREYLCKLKSKKPVIYTGDLNVAHTPLDVKNPKGKEHSAGYTIEERQKFSQLLAEGFIDTYRFLNKDKIEYSWWSYMFQSRQKNIGWRLDYFITSENLIANIISSSIDTMVLGSDHAPIKLVINID